MHNDAFVFDYPFRLVIGTRDNPPLNYRVFTRVTQGGAVKYIEHGARELPMAIPVKTSVYLLPDDLDNDIDLFIESWVWIEYEDGGYKLELTFYGRLSTEPKCYHYNINYLEH